MRTIASETVSLGLTKHDKEIETKRDLSYLNHDFPCVVPAGTKLTIYWSTKIPSRVYFDFAGHLRATRVSNMHKTFYGKFSKMPRPETLEKWEYNKGGCRTVTGHWTEPDGYGPDGSPSWMLVMGVI